MTETALLQIEEMPQQSRSTSTTHDRSINLANDRCASGKEVQPSRSVNIQKKPRLGCAGLVRCGDGVLLGRRDKEPNRGLWVLPGGGVEFGETFAATLARELLEEAGIDVEIESIFKVYELINPPDEHRVIVYLIARHRSGEPVPSSDLSDVRFFSRDELKEISRQRQISPFVETVLREARLL
jgi:8-oxo-dGTP diphosphatase